MTRRTTVSLVLTLFTLLLGILVLVGWWTRDDVLRAIIPGQVKMKVNVALGFGLSSIVLLLNYFPGKGKTRKVISVGLCVTVILIGLLTLIEYVFSVNIGIDELFFRDELLTTSTYFAGRMSPLSAVNFVLIGSGLLMLNKVGTATYQFFYLSFIGFVAILMLIGFNFIADIPTFIRLAIHVSLGFIALPAAIYLAQPIFEHTISFETRLMTGYFAAIGMLVVIGVFSSYYNEKRTVANELVVHTKTEQLEVVRTLSMVKDIEAAARGYLVTGDSIYVKYFESMVSRIPPQIDLIKELTRSKPELHIKIDTLHGLINKRLDFMRLTSLTRNEKGFPAALALTTSPSSVFYARRIREVTAEIEAWEVNLLAERQKVTADNIDAYNRASVIFLVSVSVLIVAIFISSFRAITKRKRAEVALEKLNSGLEDKVTLRTAELARNESMYRGIIDNGMDIISLLDKNFKTFYRSPSSMRITGWTDEDRKKQDAVELIHPDDMDSMKVRMKETLAAPGKRLGVSFRAMHKDGHYIWIKGVITNLLDDQSIAAIITNFRDVTEERMANERFRLVVESAPNAMILVNQEGVITLVNVQTERLFGYSREQLIGQKVEMLIPPRFVKKHPEYRSSFFMSHGARMMGFGRDLYAMRKDGSSFPAEIRLNPIESPDGILVLASIVDISERKMQEANKLKSEFLANMSHELRTPMNAVLGFSELLIDKKAGELNAKQLDYINDIHASGTHLLQLINDILDLSKIESGKSELRLESFQVHEVIEEVIKVLRPVAAKKDVRIMHEFSPMVGVATIDKQKFRQVLYNLLSNGLKFNHPDGTVTIKTAPRGTHAFTVSVSDTGIGIPPEGLKKLFIPFVQLDSGSGREHEGSGLGLSLVKGIVELHRGEIKVDSTPGQGTTFIVSLPLEFGKQT